MCLKISVLSKEEKRCKIIILESISNMFMNIILAFQNRDDVGTMRICNNETNE